MSLDRQAQQIFADRLKGVQAQTYAYICALLMNPRDAGDVLQQTNLVLWQKAHLYDPEKPFAAWAYRFARFQCMAFLKKRKRDRLVFNDDFIARVSGEFEGDDTSETQLKALEQCMQSLPEKQRALVEAKYYRNEAVADIAEKIGKTPNTLSALLYRIRNALGKCISERLAAKANDSFF